VKTVSILIPSLHRPELTATCIAAIHGQTLPSSEWEVIVIENDAQPGKVLPDPRPENTHRIELPTNEGTTGSINRGVQATESRYLLLLNNDIELEPDYLEKLVKAMESDRKLGFATGKLLRATQRTHLDGAGDAMLMAGAGYRLGHLDRDKGQFDKPMAILAGCGAAVLYRREAFQRCGSLDEEFFAYLDDLDLALRTQLLGYMGTYVPDAVAYHIGSATLGNVLHPRIVEYVTRNQLFLLCKDFPRSVLWRLFPRIAVYQLLWFLFVLSHGALGPYFRGLTVALRRRQSMRQKHAELMSKRAIGDLEFMAILRLSERQIFEWHQSRPNILRSGLLKFYFRLFGKP
jgi:GT2 family glycosyltransferase